MAKVVVIGGGYGGITVAGGLDDVADVTLVETKRPVRASRGSAEGSGGFRVGTYRIYALQPTA